MKTRIIQASFTAVVLALPLLWTRGFGTEARSHVAPYRFPLSKPGEVDSDLVFYQDRVSRGPEGLDLAALASAYLRKARQTGQTCWIGEAEAAARRSLERLPVSNPGAKLTLAQAAQMKHDFAGSVAICREVLRQRPRDGRALSLLATAELGRGNLADALKAADALVDRAPLSENLALRAVVLSAHGDDREALHDFARAWAVEEPGDLEGSAWMRSMWARLHLRRGLLDDAEDLLREALRLRPSLPLALGLLGDLEQERGRLDEADHAYADAFQACGDPMWLARRARVQRLRGNASASEELLAAAEKGLREAAGHRLHLAEVLLDRGAVPEALDLAQAESRDRRTAETMDTLARAFAASGRLQEAREAIREALRTGVQDPKLHLRAADIEHRLGAESRAQLHREIAGEIRS